jgi:DNA-binding SARP family transcriptional activator/Tfp pilus assembly protein PilF
MEFRLLGPVEAQAGDRLLGIGHPRQRAVLAVLLLEAGRLVSADRLIDRVWGDEPPPSVRNALSAYVARLRSVLAVADGQGVVLARRTGGYLLATDPAEVDLFRFRRLAADAACGRDAEQAASMLGAAVRLWRGPALAGVDSSWLNAMRDTLEQERHAAVLDLNDARLRLGEHAGLASELVGQAADAPADERLIGQLMLALHRCGRQAEALRWFEQTRAYLVSELGADPSLDLRTLHERILRADPALELPAAPVAIGGGGREPGAELGGMTARAPRELPADVAAFTGRAAELAALDDVLLGADANAGAGQPTAAVISAVSGTAGVGKTALAVHWAHRAAPHFPDGQLHVNLRGYDPEQPITAADALAAFLRSLGVPGPEIPVEDTERAARYRSLLAGKQVLIVLDNASTVEQVRSLLPGSPSCAVLVTSRDSLAGLVSRDGARRLDLDLLPLPDAIALLRELIRAQADAEPEAVAELARQCARLPLALRVAAELATSRPSVPLADLVAELADQQRRLDLLSADDDPRTAVRAVFSWSYEHLDPDSARGFRLAGLHPGADFDAYAVAALLDSKLERARRVLDTLTRAHLLQPTAPGRHGMHDLLRAYARDRAAEVDDDEESRAALTRLFDYYLSTAAVAIDTLYPTERHRRPEVGPPSSPAPVITGTDAAITWLDAELSNFVAVAVHAAEHSWPSHATRLSGTLFSYLQDGGHSPDEVVIHAAARHAAHKAGDLAAEAAALRGLGAVAWSQGRYGQAAEHFRQALTRIRKAGDRVGAGRLLINLGIVEWERGAYPKAGRYYRQALAALKEVGDINGQAGALNGIGILSKDAGRYRQAADYFDRALSLFRKSGNKSGQTIALTNLGDAECQLGRYHEAAGHHRHAMALSRELGDRRIEAQTLANLGLVDYGRHRYGRAIEWLRQSLTIYQELGELAREARVRNDLGAALLATAEPGDAERDHVSALALASQVGHKREQARAYDGLGNCRHANGDLERAREHWQQALALFTELGAAEAHEVSARLGSLPGPA